MSMSGKKKGIVTQYLMWAQVEVRITKSFQGIFYHRILNQQQLMEAEVVVKVI